MRKYRVALWAQVAFFWLVSLVMMTHAPAIVAMHFNRVGTADSFASRLGLLLLPVLLTVIAAVLQLVATRQRRRVGLESLPILLLGEWRYLGVLAVCLVVFIGLSFQQVGWLG